MSQSRYSKVQLFMCRDGQDGRFTPAALRKLLAERKFTSYSIRVAVKPEVSQQDRTKSEAILKADCQRAGVDSRSESDTDRQTYRRILSKHLCRISPWMWFPMTEAQFNDLVDTAERCPEPQVIAVFVENTTPERLTILEVWAEHENREYSAANLRWDLHSQELL